MSDKKIQKHCVIMAGGSGTRFWPLSRKDNPKQLLCLNGDTTLIEQAVTRANNISDEDNIHVVSSLITKKRTKLALKKFKRINFIFEPKGRNTAPCIGYMAFKLCSLYGPDTVMIVLPSDHAIKDNSGFKKTINAAIKLCHKTHSLVTIGIKPTNPHTGYGYIEKGKLLRTNDGLKIYKVASFKEKPDLKTSVKFLRNGSYMWNAGIFIVRVDEMIKALKANMPKLYNDLNKLSKSFGTKNEQKIFKHLFPKLDAQSIDYGVIEKMKNVTTIPASFDWNDLGSWSSIKTKKDNAKQIAVTSSNNSIFSSCNKKLISTIDVKDLIIIDTPDALLISKKESDQKVKDVVVKIKELGWDEYL